MIWLLLCTLTARVPEDFAAGTIAESLNMHATGRWNRGTVQAVENAWGRVYCGTASSILVVRNGEFRTPPSTLRIELPGIAQDLLIEGNRAYLAAGRAGIVMLDVDDPDQPAIAGSLDLPGYAWSVSEENGLAVVALGRSGVALVDVSVGSPRLISTVTPADSVKAAVLRAGYAYLACADDGLVILDVSNPSQPFSVARLAADGPALGVTVQDTFAWLACGDSGVTLANVARPNRPFVIRRYGWPGALRVTIADTLAAIACGPNGVFLVNVGFPEAPYLYRHLAIHNAYVQDVSFDDRLMNVAAGPAGLWRYDVSNPFLPESLWALPQPGYARDVAVQGNVGWIATSTGLFSVDLTPDQIPDLGSCALPAPPLRIAAGDGIVAATMGTPEIAFVDGADPRHPVLGWTMRIPGGPLASAFQDSWLYVGTADSGIQVVSLAKPAGPRIVSRLYLSGRITHIILSGSLLLATGDFGLQFCSIADPRTPAPIARFAFPGVIRSASLSSDGDTTPSSLPLAAACGDSGLFLIDVHDPQRPQVIARIPLIAAGWDVLLAQPFCYLAEDWAGLLVFDISDPKSPLLLGYYTGPSVVRSLALAGDRPLAADVYSGLLRLKFDRPPTALPEVLPGLLHLSVASISRAPQIAVSVLADEAPGSLELFDIAGRRMLRVPVNGQPGWQLKSLPSDLLGAGVYYLRFTSRHQTSSARIQIVR
jgi:hypothetical protein